MDGTFSRGQGLANGMLATPTHTPRGRGFDTSLGYFEHKNDFLTKGIMPSRSSFISGTPMFPVEEELLRVSIIGITLRPTRTRLTWPRLQAPDEYRALPRNMFAVSKRASRTTWPTEKPLNSSMRRRSRHDHAEMRQAQLYDSSASGMLEESAWQPPLTRWEVRRWPRDGLHLGRLCPERAATTSEVVMHIADWYATLASLASLPPNGSHRLRLGRIGRAEPRRSRTSHPALGYGTLTRNRG